MFEDEIIVSTVVFTESCILAHEPSARRSTERLSLQKLEASMFGEENGGTENFCRVDAKMHLWC